MKFIYHFVFLTLHLITITKSTPVESNRLSQDYSRAKQILLARRLHRDSSISLSEETGEQLLAKQEEMVKNGNIYKRHCFAKSTMVTLTDNYNHEKVQIEDIKEGDKVLAQNSQGEIVPVEVVIKDKYEGQQQVLNFRLSNGNTISVTPNHAMLVFDEGDSINQFKKKNLVLASDVRRGMKFRVLKDGQVALAEVVEISQGITDSVYNIVGPHFNLLANDIVVSSLGDTTIKYPDAVFQAGQIIYDWIGTRAARQVYRFFDGFETFQMN